MVQKNIQDGFSKLIKHIDMQLAKHLLADNLYEVRCAKIGYLFKKYETPVSIQLTKLYGKIDLEICKKSRKV